MSDCTKSDTPRIAVFAILSIAIILLGCLLRSIWHFGIYGGLWIGFCDSAGLILAITSVLRREKPPMLSWLAWVLGLAPYIVVFVTNG